MAVQIRSKRKKNFKSNEGVQFEQPASLSRAVEKDEQSSLIVRRSSRKPKPKKLCDDFEEDMMLGINIKQEPLDEDELTPTVYMTETPVFDTGPDPEEASFVNTPSGSGHADVRRETRKSFKNYLETLGYNRDFSKISAEEREHFEWQARKNSGRKNKLNINTRPNIDQSRPQANNVTSEQPNASSNIQASFRMTRPKKTFGLPNKQIGSTPASKSGLSKELKDVGADACTTSTKKGKTRVFGNEKSKNTEQRRSRTRPREQSTSTPLSTNEVEASDALSDEIDGTPTRTSGRIRVPKRQFSLLEDESQCDAKRQKITPEHIPSEEKKGKQKESIPPNDDQAKAKSLLVVKRSNLKRGKMKNETSKKMSDSCPGKVKKIIEDINIKREVDTSKSSQSETEKKTVVKKGRERIEKIVETLLLAKQSDLASSKETHPEEKGQKKGVKRKRETTEGTKKNDGKKDGLKKAKKQTEKGHIVLKLHIPHEKDKDKMKNATEKHHHKHHHHHKHKKSKQGVTVVKKQKNKSTAASKVSKKEKANGPAKKTVKKMKMNIKQEPNDDTHPHVKLIIKKSPSKSAKIAEVMMQDMSEPSTDLPDEIDQDNKEKAPVTKQSMKKKLTKKKYKSLAVKPLPPRPFRKKKDKTMKARTVSAYSLFTKNRRKGLLEREPNLDFASTSRRLAQMWKNLSIADQEYWKAKARAVRMPNGRDPTRSFLRSRKGRYDSYNWSHFSDVPPSSTGTEAIDMAAYLKLLGESLCSIGMCLKRQDQMEVHGSLSVLLDTALCSIVPVFCLTSQIPELAGCSHETQAQILENLAYIIPGL